MLHFCSVNDIKTVLTAADRFTDIIDRARKSVTEEMNRYMRRTLDYETSIVEYFDSDQTRFTPQKIWLRKKNVDPSSVSVIYAPYHDFDNTDNVISPSLISVNPDEGTITINMATREREHTIMISYSGGYKALPVIPTPSTGIAYTDVMDCPNVLWNAQISECSYRLKKLLNAEVAKPRDEPEARGQMTRRHIAGMLADTVSALYPYRRPLGANVSMSQLHDNFPIGTFG
jgi:hypothetical protein